MRSAPVRVRGRLYTWDAYDAAEGCLVVGVAQCGDQAFACNVEVRLPFLAVAARHPIPSLALPDLLNRLIEYLENLAEIQEREVGCLVEKIVDETDGNPYPLPYFREQDLAAEDAHAARISNAMTRKVAFELTRLAIPYEFRFEEEAADDERLSEIWDM